MRYEKKAFFKDNKGNVQMAEIKFSPGTLLTIETYNNSQETAYMYLYFHENNRIYLDTIYCFNNFRGNGIATWISNLADYLLSDYENYIIRGVFKPVQKSFDLVDKPISQEKLILMAKKFYNKCGYKVVSLSEYIENPAEFPYINLDCDFQLGEELAKYIVIKKNIKKGYFFYEENGCIYSKNFMN